MHNYKIFVAKVCLKNTFR